MSVIIALNSPKCNIIEIHSFSSSSTLQNTSFFYIRAYSIWFAWGFFLATLKPHLPSLPQISKSHRKCDLDLFTVENDKYYIFQQRNTETALGFCPNGRPFVAAKPNSRRCSVRSRSSRRWKHFKRCSGVGVPPMCNHCRNKPSNYAQCRECRQAIICNPGRRLLDASVFAGLRPWSQVASFCHFWGDNELAFLSHSFSSFPLSPSP